MLILHLRNRNKKTFLFDKELIVVADTILLDKDTFKYDVKSSYGDWVYKETTEVVGITVTINTENGPIDNTYYVRGVPRNQVGGDNTWDYAVIRDARTRKIITKV